MKLANLQRAHLRAWVQGAFRLATVLVIGTVVVAQGAASITVETIGQRLSDPSASARRTFILGLADLSDEDLTDPARTFATRRLLRMYRQDPDPGTHSAIRWLLGHDRQGERRRALDWGQAEALSRIERDLAGRSGAERDWFVTSTGQTMTVVRGPVEFIMGSPPDEAGRTPDEARHRVRIPRSFAIATTEVTVAQFQQFLDANPEVKAQHTRLDNPGQIAEALQRLSPDDDGPRTMMTWYEAAMYCNWLSRQEGLPESEWVYPTGFHEIVDGMVLPDDHLHRLGYRLPTEAEWEYAARAGASTARFYGESQNGLDQFAWYAKNPIRRKGDAPDPADPRRTWPVGQLKPNGLGLFDVYGNVWEWVHDRARDY
ncbi:MAG: formylglycine-generating enzyme family protein [Acidobacteria bacterium]|nr:formylglycine-generating enzyme family protein [Acidobacteriota bacterium]